MAETGEVPWLVSDGDGGFMRMESVVSDTISAVGYDFDTREMIVEFRHGGLYKYFDVPAVLHRAMLEPHPWHHVGDLVLEHEFEKLS